MKLNHLPDKTLLLHMNALVQRERALLSEVLWHLKEIDRRKLYCELKCGSLFQYCVKVLKYSEGQASRRVTASRLLKELPEISKDIQKGDITLSQLNQAKGFFEDLGITKPEEKRKVIAEIKGKTVKETESILAEKRDVKLPQKVTITLNKETVDILYKLKALKAHSCHDFDSLIMQMAQVSSRAWDPTVVYKTRRTSAGQSRYVQVGVKAQVWERDQGKCINCGSSYALQLDHRHPYSLGGKTTNDNLQLLCRNCNQRKGHRIYTPFT